MSNPIPQSSTINLVQAHLFSAEQSKLDQTSNVRKIKDSVVSASPQKSSIKISQDQWMRPQLAQGKSKLPQSALQILAEAFSEAYSTIGDGINTSVKSYSNFQKFEQSQAHNIEVETQKKITEMREHEKKQNSASSEQKTFSTVDEALTWTMIGVGILLAVFTCGGSLVADAGIAAAEAGAEVGSEAGVEMGEMGAEVGEEAGEEAGDEGGLKSKWVNSKVGKAVGNLYKAQQSLSKAGQIGLKATTAGVLSAPMLASGIANIAIFAPQESSLARVEKKIGESSAQIEENSMNLKFLQQILDRSTAILQKEIGSAAQVISTFAATARSYTGISSSLANAV